MSSRIVNKRFVTLLRLKLLRKIVLEEKRIAGTIDAIREHDKEQKQIYKDIVKPYP